MAYKLNDEMHSGEKQFSLKPLIEALKTYVTNFEDWSWEQREEHWCKVVGLEQKPLPAYVRHHYCAPEKSFWRPDFKKSTLKRWLKFYNYPEGGYHYDDDYRENEYWDSSLAGLGDKFGIKRGPGREGAGVPCITRVGEAVFDLEAITALDEVRTNDLNELIKRLQILIYTLDENAELRFGNY